MTTKLDWDQNDRFLSNDGVGPYVARILCSSGGTLTMERWHKKKPSRVVRFTLPERFLMSEQCGWKQVS